MKLRKAQKIRLASRMIRLAREIQSGNTKVVEMEEIEPQESTPVKERKQKE